MPYELQIWERFIKLPIDFNVKEEEIEKERVVYYKFYKDSKTFDSKGWKTQVAVNGEDLPSKEGDGYDFVEANIPSGVNF